MKKCLNISGKINEKKKLQNSIMIGFQFYLNRYKQL